MKATLEFGRHDWSSLQIRSGTADRIPSALLNLASASSKEDALRAYWNVDNRVVVQGSLYEASVATAACAVSLLLRASEHGRVGLLDLLAQLANGETPTSEIERTGIDLRRLCAQQCIAGLAIYIDILERGSLEEKFHCVDLIALCALEDPVWRPAAEWVLSPIREHEVEGLAAVASSWLSDLTAEA